MVALRVDGFREHEWRSTYSSSKRVSVGPEAGGG